VGKADDRSRRLAIIAVMIRICATLPVVLGLSFLGFGCAGDDGSGATEGTESAGSESESESESETGDEGADYGGGERLRPRVWQPESGPAARFGWHDSELDHSCEFRVLSDGEMRCVPHTFVGGVRFFGDASCSQRVQHLSQLDDPPYPGFAWSPAASAGCDGIATIDVHAISGALQTGVLYELDEVDGCVIALADPVEYIPVGPAIDPATYVAASVMLGEGSERILGERRTAEDGSWSYVGAYDQERAVASDVYLTEDGVARWLPLGGVNYDGRIFLDAECSEPVGGGPINCPDAVEAYVNDRSNNSCRETRKVYASGPEHVGPIYAQEGPTCQEYMSGSFHYYPVGAAIPDGDFAEATLETYGMGRVLMRYWSGEGSQRLDGESFIDTEHEGVVCRPLPDLDGVIRCLPGNLIDSSSFVYYSDPECMSGPIGLLPTCLGDVPPYGTLQDPSCDGECYQPYTLGQEIDPEVTPLYRKVDTDCLLDGGLGDDYRYIELTPMDPVDWPTVEEQIQ